MRARRSDPREAARRHFDRWAHTYEADRRSRRIAALQEEALAALALGPSDSLLDVGCGSGAAVRRAAAVARRAVGVDPSPGMLARAHELAGGMAGAEFVAGEAGRLPFDEGAFTALLCTSAFHHVPDAERALAEMRRVLAPGGRLALGDACADRRAVRIADRVLRAFQPGHIRFYRSAELRDMLRAAGLEPLESRALWEGAYLIVLAGKPS